MSDHFKSVKVDWVANAETDHFNEDTDVDDEHIVFPYPKEVGTAHGNMLKTSHNISIYKGHYYYTDVISEPFDLGAVSCDFSEEVLMAEICFGGKAETYQRSPDCKLTHGGSRTLFRRASNYEAQVIHERSNHLECTTVSLPISSLHLIIGEKSTEHVLSALNLTTSPSVTTHSLPLRINKILSAAISPHLQGSMKKLYSQSKIVEYLCELVEHIEINFNALTVDDKQVLKAQETHAYLSQVEGKLPSLLELASQAEMSAQTLNNAFRKEYGMTIHRFMIKQRLHKAHDIILETSTPLKVLAANFGYSHVNHFITAFKREFAYSPGSLRK